MNSFERPADFESGPTPDMLGVLAREIEALRQDLSAQLSQDVRWLQGEKTRLMAEIDRLRQQREQLQDAQDRVQQERWARDFAQAIASELQSQLRDRLYQEAVTRTSPGSSSYALGNGEPPAVDLAAYRSLTLLDSTINETFSTLQKDISSYQSSLSQQLSQMHSMESQAAAVLEAVLDRLMARAGITEGLGNLQHPRDSVALTPPRPETPPPATPPTTPMAAPSASRWQLGILFALLSSAAFSLQNVAVRVILFPSTLLGAWSVGGIISPSFGNSIFILWLRMLVVVPLVALLGTHIYNLDDQPFWREVFQFIRSDNTSAKLKVIGSGFFLFLSQTLAYVAFGGMAAGVVTTLILTYPIITLLLARVFFQEELTPFRLMVSLIVFLGVALIALPFDSAIEFSTLSVVTALGSGLSLALCVILAQMCFKYINPAPFTLVQFSVILVFSSFFSLFFGTIPAGIQITPGTTALLLLAGILLGLTSLASYLFQNLGIRWAGAASFSIIANTGPVMTALMAFALIGETLEILQIAGMLLVTAGVVALGVQRLQSERSP